MEENKEVVEETKVEETIEEVKEETKDENKEITADNENNKDVEIVKTEGSQNKSNDEQEEVKVVSPKSEEKETKEEPHTQSIDFSVYQKQLEEMKVMLEGLKQTNEDLVKANKEVADKNAKLEKDISELRESPFYKSSSGTSDNKMGTSTEYTQEDLGKYRRII